ncbi:SLOG family protein [Holzapfeliella sp. JNUCC 72]
MRIWLTGYRGFELNLFKEDDPKAKIIKDVIKQRLINLAENHELVWVITGGQLGIEQLALSVAISLGEDYNIKTAMLLPYQDFGSRWNEKNQEGLSNLKNRVDFCKATTNNKYQGPYQLKAYQKFILEHTDKALLVYDPEYPGKPSYDYEAIKSYQNQHDYELELIDFYDLQDAADQA